MPYKGEEITRTKLGYYTIKSDANSFKYCTRCLDVEGKNVQCIEDGYCVRCANCKFSITINIPDVMI